MEWIKVTDRLPEDYVEVLVHFERGEYDVDYIKEGIFHKNFPLQPTHWCMPTPPDNIDIWIRPAHEKYTISVTGKDLSPKELADTLINNHKIGSISVKRNYM